MPNPDQIPLKIKFIEPVSKSRKRKSHPAEVIEPQLNPTGISIAEFERVREIQRLDHFKRIKTHNKIVTRHWDLKLAALEETNRIIIVLKKELQELEEAEQTVGFLPTRDRLLTILGSTLRDYTNQTKEFSQRFNQLYNIGGDNLAHL